MSDYSGKIAVVTGAGSGIGKALALRCAQAGMRVAVADLHAGRVAVLKSQLEDQGVEVLAQTLDVADANAVSAFSADCRATFGVPHLLFNNAGILRIGETWTHAAEEWDNILKINVMGVVNGLNAFVPHMVEAGGGGHIVNTGSVGSLVAAPGMAQYTAAKMAVRGITECLALDLAAKGSNVGVSLLCPGPVLTAISDDLMGIEPAAQEVAPENHLMAGQPDFITPTECAERVFTAINAGQFWIFTHPFRTHLEGLQRAIAAGENPVYQEVVFDAQT